MADGGSGKTAIHVAVSPAEVAGLEGTFRARSCSVIHVELDGVRLRRELCDRLSETFLFPYATGSLDAAIDLLSDLSWIGNECGYLVVVEGADRASATVLADLMAILPFVADRWRSQQTTFVVLLVGAARRELCLAELRRANEELVRFAELPWAHDVFPAEVVDHQRGTSGAT